MLMLSSPPCWPRAQAVGLLFSVTLLLSVLDAALWDLNPQWINHGGDIYNRRFASTENEISITTAPYLQQRWRFDAGGVVSATPAIADGILYFPSWNGSLYAVNATNGMLVWQQNLGEMTGMASAVSRSTPSVYRQYLVVGLYGPAMLLGLQRCDGSLIWKRLLDPHPMGLITMSGTPLNGAFYVGTSSGEEIENASLCCTFQGSFKKLDIRDGTLIWTTPMLPYNNGSQSGYSGAAIWGSSPSIDIPRNLIFIATGNNYRVPDNETACEQQQQKRSTPILPDPCLNPNNHAESVLALDLTSGRIKWSTALGGFDAFTVTCLFNESMPNCPPTLGPDYDFGEAPMILTVPMDGGGSHEEGGRDIVVAGQKSGVIWALDRTNGSIVWSTVAGPGGFEGGATWGSATDGRRIYTNIANSNNNNFTLVPSNAVTVGGGWVAMDASTGHILWSTATPDGVSRATGPVTVANGVVFAGSYDPKGFVYALDANSGRILWNSSTGATVQGGFSIANGCAYIGSGYVVRNGTFNRLLYSFCVPQNAAHY